jgi:hypothetical protein
VGGDDWEAEEVLGRKFGVEKNEQKFSQFFQSRILNVVKLVS